MKERSSILKALTAGLVFSGLVACGGGTDPNSPEYQAYEARHELMESLGDAILPLNQMSNEEIPVDEAVFLQSARDLAASARMVRDTFQEQVLIPESRSTPEIWENWDDFVAKDEALVTAANELVAATEDGGFAAGRGLVRTLRDTCGGCHRPYRAPEPE